MIHIHRLEGCAPTPLAHYLKAIGILRLVGEQADADARGWWDGESFRLATILGPEELLAFFLERYRPTALLAPWNGASGFFKTWDTRTKRLRNSKNADALDTLLNHESPRWDGFREAYRVAREALKGVLREVDVSDLSAKDRTRYLIVPAGCGPVFPVADKDDDKAQIQRTMATYCASNSFYRSAIVDIGNKAPAYPSLWGSGGNDGAMDFTARYFENLIIALVDDAKPLAQEWLCSALGAVPAPSLITGKKAKVGQFHPGGAGGANSVLGPGSQDDTLLNPWDFIFMIEGAIVFTAHAVKRLGASPRSRAAAPFAVATHGAGYASASDADESARGEQWMPLWSQPFCYRELSRVLAEGRAQLGASASHEPLHLARAIARFGTARGITAFERYGYIKRNGESNLAVPLGRFHVPEQPRAQLECLDDLDGWLPRLRRETRSKNAPACLKQAERRLGDALFAVTQHPIEPSRWQHLLLALAQVEALQVTGNGFKAGPIPKLRPAWVTAADDGSPALRLAVALALQRGRFEGPDAGWWNGVRRHWLPLDRRRPGRYAQTGDIGHARLQSAPERVMLGRSGLEDAVALVERRLIEAAQHGQRRLPLIAARRAVASSADLAALCSGAIDLDQTMALARALMALDFREWKQQPIELCRPERDPRVPELPDDAWLALRLALSPAPLRTGPSGGIDIRTDPAIFRRLASGDAATALELALRRLRAAGIRTAVRATSLPAPTARRWAAALAFPISPATAARYLRRLDPTKEA